MTSNSPTVYDLKPLLAMMRSCAVAKAVSNGSLISGSRISDVCPITCGSRNRSATFSLAVIGLVVRLDVKPTNCSIRL